jgi:FixJ family two-component response regulator
LPTLVARGTRARRDRHISQFSKDSKFASPTHRRLPIQSARIMMASVDNSPRLYIVDDDEDACKSIEAIAKSVAISSRSFTSAELLLASYDKSWQGVLVIDYCLTGMNGLELQQSLLDRGCCLPVILISGYIGVRSAVQAMKLGALTVLEKPFNPDELIETIQIAMALDCRRRNERAAWERLELQLSRLTPRERQVMELLAECTPRKMIARQLGVSHRTAERLCARVYEKTGVDSPVALSRILAASRQSSKELPRYPSRSSISTAQP